MLELVRTICQNYLLELVRTTNQSKNYIFGVTSQTHKTQKNIQETPEF